MVAFQNNSLQNLNVNHKSIALFINKNLRSNLSKDLHDSIESLFVSNYGTSIFSFSISQIIMPFNNVVMHQYELQIRLAQFRKLKSYAQQTTVLHKYGVGLLLSGATNAALGIGHNIILYRFLTLMKQNKLQAKEKVEDNDEDDDGLADHTTNNYAHICCSPENPSMPVYEPKTIIDFMNIKSRFKTKKQSDDFLIQLNKITNMTIEQRGKHLEAYTEKKAITANDCKKQKLPEILIGQNGLFARKEIPAFTVLGFYTGLYFTDKEQIKKYAKENGEGFRTYIYSLPDVKYPRISGFIYGNDLTLVNAGTVFIGSEYQIAREIFEKCSISAVYAKSLEYPDPEYVADPEKYDLVTFVSNRIIKKGEQLLTNYGLNYWSSRFDDFKEVDEDKIYEYIAHFVSKDKNGFKKIYKSK